MEELLQKIRSNKHWNLSLLIVFSATLLLISYRLEQSDFIYLIGLIAPAFLIYLIAYKSSCWTMWLYLGIALRFLMIFAFPNLSDDIYRFIWDGHLLNLGYDPFEQVPSYYIQNQLEPMVLTNALFEQLNSPDYFSVYPPFAQLIFKLGSSISAGDIYTFSMVLKAFILAAETCTIFLLIKLLKHWDLRKERILLYSLNPLIIIELGGNMHFEAFMICFFVAAIYLLSKQRIVLAAMLMSGSIAAKLLTLIPQVFILKRMRLKDLLIYGTALFIFLCIFFLPVFNLEFIKNFGSSLDLYFRNFEFNASIYFLINGIVKMVKGYGLIAIVGPALSLITLLTIVGLVLKNREKDLLSLMQMSFWAFCIYLFLGTTIHPWYLALPIMLSIFTNYRFIYLWSFLAFFSYSKYSIYEDSYYQLVILEYLFVYGMLFYELYKLFIARRLQIK